MIWAYIIGFLVTEVVVFYVLYKLAPDEHYPPDCELDDGSGYDGISVLTAVVIAGVLWPVTLIAFLVEAAVRAASNRFTS